MNNPTVSINIVVLNGEKYIRHCLEAVRRQTFSHENIEVNILGNGSADGTIGIIENWKLKTENFKITFIKSDLNHGMWGGQESLLNQAEGSIVVFLSVDVILAPDFIANAVKIMEADPKIGGLQAKIYQFDLNSLPDRDYPPKETIDTCGFRIDRSRRIQNIGHGEQEKGGFDRSCDIFGVEGAVPVFRKETLEDIRIMGEIADHNLFWYGEDLDVAWRIRMAGWKQVFSPDLTAWHDRGTTKGHTHGSWLAYIRRVHIRRQIPIRRRRLEWRNTRWTRIKNDYIINVLRDLPYILWREMEVLGYAVLFEPAILKEVPAFFRGIPRMLKKRRAIMSRARASPSDIRPYFS